MEYGKTYLCFFEIDGFTKKMHIPLQPFIRMVKTPKITQWMKTGEPNQATSKFLDFELEAVDTEFKEAVYRLKS